MILCLHSMVSKQGAAGTKNESDSTRSALERCVQVYSFCTIIKRRSTVELMKNVHHSKAVTTGCSVGQNSFRGIPFWLPLAFWQLLDIIVHVMLWLMGEGKWWEAAWRISIFQWPETLSHFNCFAYFWSLYNGHLRQGVPVV